MKLNYFKQNDRSSLILQEKVQSVANVFTSSVSINMNTLTSNFKQKKNILFRQLANVCEIINKLTK